MNKILLSGVITACLAGLNAVPALAENFIENIPVQANDVRGKCAAAARPWPAFRFALNGP